MFNKILIANRGEIACRVARTAKRMGIRTVAVYSHADAQALHVNTCDEAYAIGPAPASESYLCADKILAVARQAGAEAIHPGYGFLSENAAFAQACAEAGIVFIGPPVAAIIAMGSKSEAKHLMAQAGVPLVPGYHGEAQDLDTLRSQSQQIGYPQLIKATAGGGGKGMRVVERFADFDSALAAAQREASASFGDDKVLIERYLQQPRHIELQVFADSHGNILHLFERDCSVQRRHQKVIEEAPAPHMQADLRQAMGQAAIEAARAVGYVGAGTVEFLLDSDGQFYFMEMNTRLQVEHPVTELITGQDLVEWQLRVAAGEPLPCTAAQLSIHGHAIEARVYAENPERGFLPSIGHLAYLKPPAQTKFVRVDTGVVQGDNISLYYDPMIAKLIVWDEDRPRALNRLQQALAAYGIVGVHTNLAFLNTLTQLPIFVKGAFNTGFIDQHQADLFPPPAPIPDSILALASLHELLSIQTATRTQQATTLDPYSPWAIADGWRAGMDSHHVLQWRQADQTLTVLAHYRSEGIVLDLPSGPMPVTGQLTEATELQANLAGHQVHATVVAQGDERTVLYQGQTWQLHLLDPHHAGEEQQASAGSLVAQMPGAVLAVQVAVGDQVQAGDALMVLVAMKMENTIYAPRDGEVTAVYFAAGDQVQDGDLLLDLA